MTHSSTPLPRVMLAGIAVLLLLGVGARVWNLGGPSLWLDEILQARCTAQPLSAIWQCAPANKPPLDYYIQALLIGPRPGEAAARTHAAVFGAAFLAALAWLAWRMGGAGFAFAALLAVMLSPVHIRFSQEGRPYALMLLSETLAFISLWELLRARRWETWRGWLALAGAVALAVWAFYMNIVALALALLLAAGAVLMRAAPRRELMAALASRRVWLHVGVSAGLLVLALLPLVLRTAERFDPSQRQHWGGWSLPLMMNYLDMFACGYDWYHYRDESVWLAAVYGAAGLALGLAKRESRAAALLAAVLFASAWFGTFTLYAAMDQYLEMRYTLIAFPAFMLLVALGIWRAGDDAARLIVRWREGAGAPSVLLLFACCVAVAAPWLALHASFLADRWVTRTDWRGLAQRIEREARTDSVVFVGDFLDDIALRYYFDRFQIQTPLYVSDYKAADPAGHIAAGRDVWIVTREKSAPPSFFDALPPALPEKYFLIEVRRFNAREGGVP